MGRILLFENVNAILAVKHGVNAMTNLRIKNLVGSMRKRIPCIVVVLAKSITSISHGRSCRASRACVIASLYTASVAIATATSRYSGLLQYIAYAQNCILD